TQQTQQGLPGAGRTSPAQKSGPTGTRQGSDDATVMEPGLKASTMPGRAMPNAEAEATVMERKTIGSDEATVMENFGAPPKRTVASAPMYGGGNAEATMIERQIDMRPGAASPKKNTAMLAAIAAVVVLALLGGGYFLTHRPEPVVATTTGTPSTTTLTATAPVSNAPVAPGQGALLLSASPWGDIDRIVSVPSQKPVDLSEEKRSTPARIDLDPGRYSVTLTGPKGPQTFDVEIHAGEKLSKHENLGAVDYSELEKEMNKQ
ncbi:MAG: hypothetical protein JWO56_3205, partial [Acidobacteria bacterium]|nr:hypothetical protein [Acidobacteriota bacterium]